MQKFNVFDAQVEFDDADPEGYRAGAHRFGPKIGASRIGATVYDLPPRQALCPYHYESEEEWLLVLQGELTLRHAEGEDILGPGDITAFPVGPAGGHKTTNNGTETVRMMMLANSDPIGYVVYPDSDKIGAYFKDGSHLLFRRSAAIADYYDGER